MEKNKILQASLLDIVFDNRNKVYGAYELRSRYSSRLSKALLTTGALALIVLLASFVGSKFKNDRIVSDFEKGSVTLIDPPKSDPVVEPPPPQPPVKHLEQPQIEMKKFTSLRLVDEEIKPEEVMNNITDLEDTKISTINRDGDKSDIISPPIEEKKETGIITGPKEDEKDKVHINVDVPARFPGGDEAWVKYITRQIERYMDELQDDGKTGTCIVQFIVDINGAISNVEILNMKGTKLAEISANAIRKGPQWIPAEYNGMKVKAWRKQPVTFRINEQ